jgi:ribosomal protein S27AE
MGFIASLFCDHTWDTGWERSKHQCSKCGKRELHEWEQYSGENTTTPVTKNAVSTHIGQELLRCGICGAMKWR